MTLLQRPISKTVSALSDDEPLYDSVASDEDYSSIDTQSMRSINMEMKGDITAEVTFFFLAHDFCFGDPCLL